MSYASDDNKSIPLMSSDGSIELEFDDSEYVENLETHQEKNSKVGGIQCSKE